ncbi:atl [Bugula neritina]|uniref:Atl n=1 Tax=Bugula neritina TaxID=10212 RepID=A0A7J7JKC7_BUGNE|nr:atl [Bugula neritina]
MKRSSSNSGTSSSTVTPESVGLSGYPVQIVSVGDEHSFQLEEQNLRAILNKNGVKNKPVVIVSVAGAFRKGKSFLLNFFIRYLNYVMQSENHSDYGWLDDESMALGGFSWRGGAERETTGILMWSEPFLMRTEGGEEVAVLLLDTQGAFDNKSTVKECATIFALSTMLSSIQVYNLHSNIQENDLQHLQLFTEYGKLATSDVSDIKPFQSLLFLVRDWSYPYDYEYGIEGGNQLLGTFLELSPTQHEELQLLREHIRSCFETIDCYLMPHPGLGVATNPRFDGRLSDVEVLFKEHLAQLVPQLLNQENLIIKEISGNKVTAQDLVEYFKVYMEIFKGDTLPEPKSLVRATAEANNLVALTTAKSLYTSKMESTCGGDKPYLNTEQLKEAHKIFKQQSVEAFHSVKKIGGAEFSSSYLEELEHAIDEAWENYSSANDAKSILRTMRTPITLFSCFVICYLMSGLFAVLGISALVSLLNAMLLISLVLLATWGYCRHSGELREVGTKIDEFAQLVWDLALSGPIQKISDATFSQMTGLSAGAPTANISTHTDLTSGSRITVAGSQDSGLRQRKVPSTLGTVSGS